MNAVGFFCNQLLGLSSYSMISHEAADLLNKRGLDTKDLYYAYYGTLAAYQHQGPTWRSWLDAMRDKLVTAQRDDGAWVASGSFGTRMGTIVSTAIATLSLQAHYRYTPLYGLGNEPDPALSAQLADQLLPFDEIPETPLYRHAGRLPEISSAADDVGPAVTDHGDFLYFASDRPGGEGGSDLYRARFRRQVGDDGNEHLVPVEPANLGPSINTAGDETAPALRMEGFNLLFNSANQQAGANLHSAMSKRVVRKHDYGKRPDAAWFSDNIGLIIVLAAGLIVFVVSTRYALAKPMPRGEAVHG